MEWTAQIGTNRNVLERIGALLFALADLADRASCRSWPVRRVVLPFLYRAEDAARAFLTGPAGSSSIPLPPPSAHEMPAPTMPRGHDPADAARLALSLRRLALAIAALLAQARCLSRSGEGSESSCLGSLRVGRPPSRPRHELLGALNHRAYLPP